MSFTPKSIPIHRLQEHWECQQCLCLNPGASAADIFVFEVRHAVKLPSDFAEYLLSFNGFIEPEDPDSLKGMDDDAFEFYGLGRLTPTEYSNKYYKFSFWTLGFISYAICLDPYRNHDQVVTVGRDLYIIAESFSEFTNLYIEDSPKLYSSGPLADYKREIPPS